MFRKKLATLGLAVATVVSTVGTPVLAATNNTTPVTMKADDSNLKLTVPTVIPFVMDAAGNLTTSAKGQLINGSNFAVHVSSVAVDAQAPFNIVADATVATEDNAVDFQFGKEGHLIDAKNPVLVAGQYNLEPVGGMNTLELTAVGNAKNVKEDIAADKTIANIKWTFAAGLEKGNVSTLRMTGEEATQEGFAYKQENGGITITKYTGGQAHVEVPAYIDGVPVKQISEPHPNADNSDASLLRGAFLRNEIIQAVVLPETLEVIEDYSFCYCSNLKKVVIPGNVKRIEYGAFVHCTSLSDLTIEDGVPMIGSHAFHDCQSLTYLELPNSVKTIEAKAFHTCPNLHVVVPYYASIGYEAFWSTGRVTYK